MSAENINQAILRLENKRGKIVDMKIDLLLAKLMKKEMQILMY